MTSSGEPWRGDVPFTAINAHQQDDLISSGNTLLKIISDIARYLENTSLLLRRGEMIYPSLR